MGHTLLSDKNLDDQLTASVLGPRFGFRIHIMTGTNDSIKARRMPGTIPAIRRGPRDICIRPAIMIAVALGGINGPRTPPHVRAARLIFLS